jgi:hypothetical protein
MTGLLLTRIDARVPSVVFAQVCPMDTAFAATAGMAVHTNMALRATKTFFTTCMLVSDN